MSNSKIVGTTMSADSKQSLPVWVLKWKMAKGGRGRKHAAIFISNPDHANDHPLTTAKCESTEYEVAGSPFGGFSLNVRHNWDSTAVAGLESATQVGWVNEEDRSRTDNIALTVRPPGPTSRPWIAVCASIYPCHLEDLVGLISF